MKKQPITNRVKKIYETVYKQYPNLVKAICERPEKYNKTYEKIKKLEQEGKIMVFQPQTAVKVSRLERDKEKLEKLYQQGISETEKKLDKLKEYLA